MLSRRKFLGMAGGVAAGGAVGGFGLWNAKVREYVDDRQVGAGPGSVGSSTTPTAAGSGRVLVVVQLSGGNDGLDTLIPVTDGRYHDARPTLGFGEGKVLALGGLDGWGFNPALAPLVPRWDQGRLAMIQGIGMPLQSRSHFKASDTWWSAQPGTSPTTGWLGRWLDRTGDPANPLRAISLGNGASVLTGERAVPTSVLDPRAFTLLTPRGATNDQIVSAFRATAVPVSADAWEGAAQEAVPRALDAVATLDRANAKGAAGEGNAQAGAVEGLTPLLETAAGIIDLQIGTQVIVVESGGFDTHSAQADRHPELLADLAKGVDSFLSAMERQGRGDEVLLVTVSEFGRRVAENGGGTDHGDGGLSFVAGAKVRGKQVVGQADLGDLVQGDIRSTIDSRSLYSIALDWLGGPTDEILGGTYDRYDLIAA